MQVIWTACWVFSEFNDTDPIWKKWAVCGGWRIIRSCPRGWKSYTLFGRIIMAVFYSIGFLPSAFPKRPAVYYGSLVAALCYELDHREQFWGLGDRLGRNDDSSRKRRSGCPLKIRIKISLIETKSLIWFFDNYFSVFNLPMPRRINNIKWWTQTTPMSLVVEGQAWPDQVASRYHSYPQHGPRKDMGCCLKPNPNIRRPPLLRFRSDARIHYSTQQGKGINAMPHMPATGVSGWTYSQKPVMGDWRW